MKISRRPANNPSLEKGATVLFTAICIGTIVLIICLAVETYLLLSSRAQAQAYAQYCAEAALREYILGRNESDPFTQIRDAAQIAGQRYADAQINQVFLQRTLQITSWEWGHWYYQTGANFSPGLDRQTNAVRVTVRLNTNKTVFGFVISRSRASHQFSARSLVVHDERLMQDKLYPYQFITD